MKFLTTTALLTSSITLSVTTVIFDNYAQAQQPTKQVAYCPNMTQVITLKIVDPYTVICRITDPTILVPGKTYDELELYTKDEDGKTLFSASITVYGYGIRRVTLREHKNRSMCKDIADPCARIAQFFVVDRTFRQWVPGYEKPDILDKYRSNVTLLLDTLRDNPREEIKF
ncbi:MAG: hypothetical protein KAF91_05615 [Nostoc sp. TH1S01]|nr:hypothetical protein [Nostoc sp. TH1S01]